MLTKSHSRVVQSCFALLQEREQTTEAQLAETTSQLHNLRLRQRELEARNNLLEKITALHKEQTSPSNAKPCIDIKSGRLTSSQVCQVCNVHCKLNVLHFLWHFHCAFTG